ncbi:MAG: hypothetical protein ACLRS8_02520 [Parabacteroides merdae]
MNQLDFWDGPEYAEYTRESYRNTSNNSIRYNSDVASKEQDMVCPGFTRDPSIMESVMMGWGDDGVYYPSHVRTTRYMDHVTRHRYGDRPSIEYPRWWRTDELLGFRYLQ